MQTRFQIREIDLSKGYCLSVTDKNRIRVAFDFDNLEQQVQRLEQLVAYAEDSKQELATVNLLVQRNIPVTFGKAPVDVINDTIRPNEQPKNSKAPVPAPKFGTFSAPVAVTTDSAKPKKALPVTKPHPKATSPAEVRRAVPVEQPKKN